jgi:4-amino-4-deoxy-L-arabinose transferase-like glycosyltransferase
MSSQWIQSAIHKLEFGAGPRVLRVLMLVLVLVALAVWYDTRQYRNMATQEAMDSAQVARNLAEGRGYTTMFLRPFSLFLVQRRTLATHPDELTSTNADLSRVETGHPDLANPPVYPVVLAGLMKTLPFHWPVETKKAFWTDGGRFARYQPDFLIALFNQLLLLAAVVMTFLLARKLFDLTVAWMSALLVFGSELLWQFSVSGLSTLLLLVIFLGLVRCVLKIEAEAREPLPRANWLLGLSALAGALAGAGALTRYAFGWVIIPVVIFLGFFGGPRRGMHASAAFAAFAILLVPWLARNWSVSGTLFGTAGYSVMEASMAFPGFRLEQSLSPDMRPAFWIVPYTHKLLSNLTAIFENDLPRLGGSWAAMLFLAGLLMGFRGAAVRRLRYFLLLCLGTFAVVQALGRTQLSDQSPGLNSENLLVLVAPLVFIYASVFFLTFLGQMKLPAKQMRYALIGLFALVACLPLVVTLASARQSPVANPPYYPPDIQKFSGWMKDDELIMSDVPAAVAWYGRHQCLWLTLDSRNDFYAVSDYVKPIHALYLTPLTVDGRLITDCARTGPDSWGNFALNAFVKNQTPTGFPLQNWPYGSAKLAAGGCLFLTDRQRW